MFSCISLKVLTIINSNICYMIELVFWGNEVCFCTQHTSPLQRNVMGRSAKPFKADIL